MKDDELSESRESISRDVRTHLGVAVAVLLLLGVSVAASEFGLEPRAAIFVALGIAAVQVFLLGGFMMHLFGEKRLVHVLVAMSLFLAAACIVLSAGALHDGYDGAEHIHVASPPDAEAH